MLPPDGAREGCDSLLSSLGPDVDLACRFPPQETHGCYPPTKFDCCDCTHFCVGPPPARPRPAGPSFCDETPPRLRDLHDSSKRSHQVINP